MSLGSYSSPIPIPLVRHAKRGAEPGPNEMNGRRLRDGRPDSDSSSARNACRYVKRPAVDSPLIYRPPTRPISLRMPLTPPIRSLATLSPYPNPPPCIPLATVSQSHSSAVGKGPASSPHSLHCVSVPRYTPPADRDRDRPASSFLS